jgi:hypothetical protein
MMALPAGKRFPVLVCLLPLLAAGCSSEARSAAPVAGKVTVNGQPLADIGVTFEPVGSGAGRGSFGRTDAAGNYRLRFIDNNQTGALMGKHNITFRDLQASAGAQELDAGPSLPKQKFRFPQKYMSEAQQFEVKPGSNHVNFDLK